MIDCPSDSGFSTATTRRIAWSAGSRSRSSSAGLGEAPADDLVQAAADHRVLGGAAHALGVGEPPRRAAARGQRRGQPLEAVDARDLLDQVDLARDVVAAQRRHGDLQAVRAARPGEVQRAQDLGLALARDRHAEDRPHARLAQADRLRRRRRRRRRRRSSRARASRRRARSSGARATACACMHCSGCRPFSKRPEASLRRPERPRGAVDVRPAPGRDLEQHPPRVRPHLRARAAHHARRSTSGPSASSITTISPSSVRVWPSSVSHAARPRAPGARSAVAPATRSRSNACSGWPVSSIT